MGEALTIEVRHEQGCAIVTVAGEIDISTVTQLRERLFEVAASGAPLVVDLEQVGFIDSVGLATLFGAAERAAAHGGSLQVACARPKMRELMRLIGLDRTIPLARTLDEALEFRAATPDEPAVLAGPPVGCQPADSGRVCRVTDGRTPRPALCWYRLIQPAAGPRSGPYPEKDYSP